MAKKDRQSTLTVTETGDGVDITWTMATDTNHLLCASVQAHDFNHPLYKRNRKGRNERPTA